ncbi:hypothetical protein [Lysobacter panacisoli]|uniref:Tetratricopeptide repeat protein n=1 Tax=Lysobacter panacisoli TaxID=1255263 RepID=A0ABP9LHU0_9GAMM|nr:hypothetical protein [Lysobacter panacisoli]
MPNTFSPMLRNALGLIVLTVAAALPLRASAQTVERVAPTVELAMDEQTRHKIPSIPIFYGERYEGVLDDNSAYFAAMETLSFFKVQPSNFNVAFFDIDLLKGDTLTYGVVHDVEDGVMTSVYFQNTNKKGVTEWKPVASMGAWWSRRSNECTHTVSVPESSKYRIAVYTNKPMPSLHYKLYVLPKAKPAACGKRVDQEDKDFIAAPGKPASQAIADAWEGRERFHVAAATAPYLMPETDDANAYAQSKPEALRPFYRTLFLDGEHNAVLNFQRLGLAAMESGDYAAAEWAFDEALGRIEAFYGQTAIAKDARSKWTKEGIKDYKGEPYERAMAYYYRGLLYLRAGDYQNARASFMSGEYQDTLSEVEEFQGDFAVMNYLAGWASYCMADTGNAQDAFAAATAVNPSVRVPTTENTLLIAELGRGPLKMARGSQNKLLTFADVPDSGRGESASFALGGKVKPAPAKGKGKAAPAPALSPLAVYSDVHYQATTRGGRAFDAILDGKAQLKNGLFGTAEIGYLLTQSGVLPVVAAGAVIMIATGAIGNKVKPDADVRVWDSLPQQISVGLAGSGKTTPTVDFRIVDADGQARTAIAPMTARHGRCGIAWTRSRSALDVPAGAPGNDEDFVKARLKNKEAVARDASFRTALLSDVPQPVAEGAGAPAATGAR